MQFTDLKTPYAALKDRIAARMQRVLDHGQYIMGPEVAELEAALASRVGVRHCVTVASGTEALLIALMAIGLKPGDEVVTTPFTFAATAETIVLLGGVPVYVDIEADTCNIDAGRIEAAIGPRTRAIMPVSLYGQCADMAAIRDIARRHGDLPVIEDAAQSFGAHCQGLASCALSAIGCTSFFPSKPLGCYGDGGALFTNDDELAQAVREIRVHGQSRRYHHTRVGVGGRMDTLQCAIVLAKLERFDWEFQARAERAKRYSLALTGLPGITVPMVRPDRDNAWAQYTLRASLRDALAAALKREGIPSSIHYPVPLHHQPAYAPPAAATAEPLPESVAAAAEVLSLPLSADLSDGDQDRVIAAVTAFAHAHAAA